MANLASLPDTLADEQKVDTADSDDALFALLYKSEAAVTTDKPMLQQLLDTSRQWNARHNITGVLLHRGVEFMQLLEGRKDRVLSLYDKISQDTRHTNLEIIISGGIDKRSLPRWHMGFLLVDNHNFNNLYLDHVVKLAAEDFTGASRQFYTHLNKFALAPRSETKQQSAS